MRRKRLSENMLEQLAVMAASRPSARFTLGEQIDPSTASALYDAGLVNLAFTGKTEICWATPLARQLLKYEWE